MVFLSGWEMFDFRDHIGREHIEGGAMLNDASGMEDDIARDIDNLFLNRFSRLYLVDRFKRSPHNIEIVYPRVPYPGRKPLIKGPDHIRFLLSLYPRVTDFENVEKIVLRPRYIEAGSIELLALYLRRRKILVLYLHHPFYYTIDQAFQRYTEFAPLDLTKLSGMKNAAPSAFSEDTAGSGSIKIPPLWYILSLISHSDDALIDKFFLRGEQADGESSHRYLNEISFFYSRQGY